MTPLPPKKNSERQGIRDKSVDDITRLGQAEGCAIQYLFWGVENLCNTQLLKNDIGIGK
jgi:hypothetical protein